MKVRATAKGYHGHQIKYPGEVFELFPYEAKNDKGEVEKVSADDQFADSWMETIDGSIPVSKVKAGANQSADGKEDPNRPLNTNIDDNRRTMDELALAHGGEQDADKVKKAAKGKSVI